MSKLDRTRAALARLVLAAGKIRLDDLAIVGGLPTREAGESDDWLRRRMVEALAEEGAARCSFCQRYDGQVGRLVAGGNGPACICAGARVHDGDADRVTARRAATAAR